MESQTRGLRSAASFSNLEALLVSEKEASKHEAARARNQVSGAGRAASKLIAPRPQRALRSTSFMRDQSGWVVGLASDGESTLHARLGMSQSGGFEKRSIFEDSPLSQRQAPLFGQASADLHAILTADNMSAMSTSVQSFSSQPSGSEDVDMSESLISDASNAKEPCEDANRGGIAIPARPVPDVSNDLLNNFSPPERHGAPVCGNVPVRASVSASGRGEPLAPRSVGGGRRGL